MITEKDIEQARTKTEELANIYLKGVTNFVKWTSTVVIASILWIATNLAKTSSISDVIAISGLSFLVISLIIAIFTVSKVLNAVGAIWEYVDADYTYCVMKKFKKFEPENVPKEKEANIVNDLIEKINKTKPYSKPKIFNNYVSLHILFLVLGLMAFTVSRIQAIFK
jgi:hypothetical protein